MSCGSFSSFKSKGENGNQRKITQSKFTKIGRLADIEIYRYIGLCNMVIL